ncbi:hypothetical protein N7490_006038 [Penicillium lividum]|nr:hypothetical protein N7490_006038 [Penicillium lividum]
MTEVSGASSVLLWCLPCFRRALSAFDPHNGEKFIVHCHDDMIKERCIECQRPEHRGSVCQTTSSAMLGNAMEFVLRLHWVSAYFDSENPLPIQFRIEVAKLIKELARVFLSVENRHRREHNISGRERFERRAGAAAYGAFVAAREAANLPQEELQEGWLSLAPGDAGYEEWKRAKAKFHVDMVTLVDVAW